MISFCDKALSYTTGLDRSTFGADPMRYDATLRNIELIGEAATHVPVSDDLVPLRAALERLLAGQDRP